MCGLCFARPLEETAAALGFRGVSEVRFSVWLMHLGAEPGSDTALDLWARYTAARGTRADVESTITQPGWVS